MAVTAFLYAKAMLSLVNKEIDWNAGGAKVLANPFECEGITRTINYLV